MDLPNDEAARFYAQTYDASVSDWPGELAFYQELAEDANSSGSAMLELACGTGRVATRLARAGIDVLGLDRSPAMLEIARRNSIGIPNLRWVQADMRTFDLEETFRLAIIPGHAFQNLLTPEDQLACLKCIRRHLDPGGRLVVHLDHQDVDWLGELMGDKGGVFEREEEFAHPETGSLYRASRAWSYERSTQTAIVQTLWEEIGDDGTVASRIESGPVRLHCAFRFEMEHLFPLAGYQIDAVFGDFDKHELTDESTGMIWIARNV
jgi:ubiquinone/menaquinone biosynthesis C-methylase UbiE